MKHFLLGVLQCGIKQTFLCNSINVIGQSQRKYICIQAIDHGMCLLLRTNMRLFNTEFIARLGLPVSPPYLHHSIAFGFAPTRH